MRIVKLFSTGGTTVDVMFRGPSNSTEAHTFSTCKKSKEWTSVEFANSSMLKLIKSSWVNEYVEVKRESDISLWVRSGYLYPAWALLSREIVGCQVVPRSDLPPPYPYKVVP